MKNLTFLSVRLLILISLLLTNLSPVHSTGGEITPIPKVNKEFLIVAHIVTNEDSVAGITEAHILSELKVVNTYFAPIGVSFTICEFKYFYNYNYNSVNDRTQKELYTQARLDNRINMFFVEGHTEPGIAICGNATLGGINMPTTGGILILKGDCATSSTIAHELGHYFSLDHTFSPTDGLELVNGSNCATAGDGVCDTPADPYDESKSLSEYVNDACEFIYNGKDTNGDFYNPDVANVMGYYKKCRCPKFTHGQYVKMANYYLSHPVMW